MRIAFYEDVSAGQFGPIALARPLCELRCGCFTQRERFLRTNSIEEWGCFTRDEIQNVYSLEQPDAIINDYDWLSRKSTLLLSSRWIPDCDSLSGIEPDEIGICDDVPVYVTLHPDEGILLSEGLWTEGMAKIAKTRKFVSVGGVVLNRAWDLVEQNSKQIIHDYRALLGDKRELQSVNKTQYEVIGNHSDLWIGQSSIIDPFVLFDVSEGPVVIGDNVHISAFSKITGPCSIGSGSQLIRAFVKSGVSAGPECRLSGEIESTIFQSHVNKYHTGFLGHSYICPWVNLGAMTTNSDLKNDYSSVSIPVGNEYISTGLKKAGCFIGDHAKTALGSLFNTGTSVGPFAMVLPDGELLPKEIPPFSLYRHGELQDAWPLERYLKTAETVMERRNIKMGEEYRNLYSFMYQSSNAHRERISNSARSNQAKRHS